MNGVDLPIGLFVIGGGVLVAVIAAVLIWVAMSGGRRQE
jgi:hypothetical protein